MAVNARFGGLFAVALAVAVVAPAEGQSSGESFLFREPGQSFTLRGGYGFAAADSDIFSFATDNLTLGQSDFSGPSVAADIGFRVAPRLRAQVGVGYLRGSAGSEFRDWIGNDDRPIEQTTTFQRLPITLSARYDVTAPGRSFSRFVWVPARATMFVGAGAGAQGSSGAWGSPAATSRSGSSGTSTVFPSGAS